jgi:hypothetical protein
MRVPVGKARRAAAAAACLIECASCADAPRLGQLAVPAACGATAAFTRQVWNVVASKRSSARCGVCMSRNLCVPCAFRKRGISGSVLGAVGTSAY